MTDLEYGGWLSIGVFGVEVEIENEEIHSASSSPSWLARKLGDLTLTRIVPAFRHQVAYQAEIFFHVICTIIFRQGCLASSGSLGSILGGF